VPYCTNCGKEIAPGLRFCAYCGAEVPQAPTAAPPPPSPPPSIPYAPLPTFSAPPPSADTGLASRMIQAMKLDSSLYEEVEKDEEAMRQAVTVVVISSLCAGIGSMIGSLFRGGIGLALIGTIAGVIGALVGWFVWSFITYIVGTRITRGPETQAEYGELLRVIGFSSSPGVFHVLNFIPFVSLIVGIWQLAAMVIAVRQALDFSTMRAILTCIIGWIANVIVWVLIAGLIALPFVL